jgi:hypothetical protein
MAAPTKPAVVKILLANPEPSTHGPKRLKWGCGGCNAKRLRPTSKRTAYLPMLALRSSSVQKQKPLDVLNQAHSIIGFWKKAISVKPMTCRERLAGG